MVVPLKPCAVLYHYPCLDGAFAALAAHLYFSLISHPVSFFPNRVYEPIRAESLPPNEFDEVYLLDFIGPSGFIRELSPKVKRIIIIDHHKTALEMLREDTYTSDNILKVIDMERSAATIAYDYFQAKLLGHGMTLAEYLKHDASVKKELIPTVDEERLHKLFKYVEDGDIWKWVLPDSKAFGSGLKNMNIEFDVRLNPSLFNQLLALDPVSVINQGKTTLLHEQKLIDDILEQSYEISLGRGLFGNCLAVDADCVSNLRSELGHRLAEKSLKMKLRSIGAIVYRVPELQNDNLVKISLRSLGAEDTTNISLNYGGGGHRNASSFMLTSAEFKIWKG